MISMKTNTMRTYLFFKRFMFIYSSVTYKNTQSFVTTVQMLFINLYNKSCYKVYQNYWGYLVIVSMLHNVRNYS
ncbi:hypothetical protein RB653_005307 [Dictyostelium firmibasis]|uniref:Uncharacterized protein n=1 Tax=Dictyostelium firmibasis TaxID=79012 RepID=A0AAN7U113_9MYCE